MRALDSQRHLRPSPTRRPCRAGARVWLPTALLWLAWRLPLHGQVLLCGYDLTIVPGWNLIANQCDRGDNSLNTVLPVVPDGSVLRKHSPGNGPESALYGPITSTTRGWQPNLALRPGEGAYLYNPTDTNYTLAISGTPPTPQLAPQTLALTLLSRRTAGPADFGDLVEGPPRECMVVYRHRPGARPLPVGGAESYFAHVYRQGTWHPAPPTARVGEAVWIGADTQNSGVRSVRADCATGLVTVEFGEIMNLPAALSATNYALRQGTTPVPVLARSLGANVYSVSLRAPALAPNTVYTLALAPTLTDLCGNPLPPGTRVPFLCAGPLTITEAPTSQTGCAGESLSLTVGAVSATPIRYRWIWSAANALVDTTNVVGSASRTLTFEPLLPHNAGIYWVEVSDADSTITIGPLQIGVTGPCLNINRNGQDLVLSWASPYEQMYLQRATNLPPSSWSTVATNSPHTNQIGRTSAFFRLSSMP